MKNLTAFFECCYRNYITRTGYILISISIILFYVELTTFASIVLFYGVASTALTGFGFNSYHYYKRSLNNLVNNRENEKPYGYCGDIGCQISLERFNKDTCK